MEVQGKVVPEEKEEVRASSKVRWKEAKQPQGQSKRGERQVPPPTATGAMALGQPGVRKVARGDKYQCIFSLHLDTSTSKEGNNGASLHLPSIKCVVCYLFYPHSLRKVNPTSIGGEVP